MTVRRLRADEAALFRTVRLRALADAPAAFAHTHAEISAKPDAYWQDMTCSVTEPEGHAMFVAERAGEPVGMVFGLMDRDRPTRAHLGGMWVDPGARQQGLGRTLSDAVIGWARERGFADIALWVTEGNKAAITLYEHLGFTPTGRRDRHPHRPELSILEMGRPL